MAKRMHTRAQLSWARVSHIVVGKYITVYNIYYYNNEKYIMYCVLCACVIYTLQRYACVLRAGPGSCRGGVYTTIWIGT